MEIIETQGSWNDIVWGSVEIQSQVLQSIIHIY